MPTLRDYQRTIAAGLLSGDFGTAASLIDVHDPPLDRLHIHRNTMLSSLENALALTYPAVKALVGADFFAQSARAFILAEQPHAALLSVYGSGFAGFLAGYAPAATLSYLPDVARLEWVVGRVASSSDDDLPRTEVELEGTLLSFAPSLTLIEINYPAVAIWRATLDGDGDALSRIDLAPAPHFAAVWRAGDGVNVSSVSAGAGAFVLTLLDEGDAGAALTAAANSDLDPIATVSSEVLCAGFSRLSGAPQ